MKKMNPLQKKAAALLIGGTMATGIGAATSAPAHADTTPKACQNSSDPKSVAGANAAAGAFAFCLAYDQKKERGQAVQDALVAAYDDPKANPDHLNVAIVNKEQDINVEGDVVSDSPISRDVIGRGDYHLYYLGKGQARIINKGDGGWINWGIRGTNYHRADEGSTKIFVSN